MTQPNVQELTGFRAAAVELRRIADAVEGLPGAPRYMSVDFQTLPDRGTGEEIAAGVDEVALAVLGKPGEDRSVGNGRRQRHVNAYEHPLPGVSFSVSVYQMYPTPDPKDVEIERLKSELAALRDESEARITRTGHPAVEPATT